MIELGIILIVFAGIAEHFKDLSEEGKLSGYWDKNHEPMFFNGKVWGSITGYTLKLPYFEQLWWKVHWLQGKPWKYIPVWIRKYLSFRDGWHLLKFISLNFYAIGILLIFNTDWWWYFILRFTFSAPESVLRFLRRKF